MKKGKRAIKLNRGLKSFKKKERVTLAVKKKEVSKKSLQVIKWTVLRRVVAYTDFWKEGKVLIQGDRVRRNRGERENPEPPFPGQNCTGTSGCKRKEPGLPGDCVNRFRVMRQKRTFSEEEKRKKPFSKEGEDLLPKFQGTHKKKNSLAPGGKNQGCLLFSKNKNPKERGRRSEE